MVTSLAMLGGALLVDGLTFCCRLLLLAWSGRWGLFVTKKLANCRGDWSDASSNAAYSGYLSQLRQRSLDSGQYRWSDKRKAVEARRVRVVKPG